MCAKCTDRHRQFNYYILFCKSSQNINIEGVQVYYITLNTRACLPFYTDLWTFYSFKFDELNGHSADIMLHVTARLAAVWQTAIVQDGTNPHTVCMAICINSVTTNEHDLKKINKTVTLLFEWMSNMSAVLVHTVTFSMGKLVLQYIQNLGRRRLPLLRLRASAKWLNVPSALQC